jgi:CBS domain-containing protein
MDREFVTVSPRMGLDEVYKRLMADKKTAVVVVEGGRLEGIIGLDGISRYFMIKTALRGEKADNFSPPADV